MLNFSKWKTGFVLLVCLFGILGSLPNFLTEQERASLPNWMPSSAVNLGLDLQGGAHLLLEVDVDGAIAKRVDNLVDDVRRVLSTASPRVMYRGLKADGTAVKLTLRNTEDQDRAIALLRTLAQPIASSNPLAVGRLDLEISTGDAEGDIAVSMTEEGLEASKIAIANQTVEVVRNRIDQMGTKEPSIQRQGMDRIIVQVPGLQDTQRIKDIIETTAEMSFHLVDMTATPEDIQSGRAAPGTEIVEMAEGGSKIAIYRRSRLTGENLTNAQGSFDQNGLPAVSFNFDAKGAKIFGEITMKNVNKRFAILLDGKVITAPNINGPILGGSGIIMGNFTVESANDLAVLLRAGALPAKTNILEERSVGPDLGADSIEAGKMAAIVGMIGVLIYMILSYGTFGVLADIALIFNITMILALLSSLGATLTLPGIAGIVLTIGMAVDANVLVFERIREELAAGVKVYKAIETGYQQALSTILDANITTLIAAIVLFQFGSGPIKGFAVTLAIGIFTSVFTAVVLTRLFISWWVKSRKSETLKL